MKDIDGLVAASWEGDKLATSRLSGEMSTRRMSWKGYFRIRAKRIISV